jgi:hypothetical protein
VKANPRRCIIALALSLIGGAPLSAGLIINVAYNTGCAPSDGCTPIPAIAEADFNSLIARYESAFSNNITVNLDVNWGATGLGQSTTLQYFTTYSAWTAALANDGSANPQNLYLAAALATLPATDTIGDGTVLVNSANAKALGLVDPNGGTTDSSLLFSNTAPFEYNGVAASGKYDFMDAAAHELNEALGIGSALSGVANNAAVPSCGALGSTGTCYDAEDFFRYSAPGQRAVTTNPTALVYFSYNGGTTDVAQFNQNNNAGGNTSADRNDWVYGNDNPGGAGTCPALAPGPYIQDAIGCPDAAIVAAQAGSPEFVALETLGYDAPEPASILLFIAGMGLIAVIRQARRKTA